MAKFDKIAPLYDSSLIQFAYRKIHINSIHFLKEYIEDDFRVLDIGCGTGNFLQRLEKLRKNLTLFGIDESKNMIRIACNKLKNTNIRLLKATGENLPFRNNYFHLITIIDTFYLFKDKGTVLSECYRVLKQDGCLFIYTPSIDHFLSRWCTKAVRIIKYFYTEKRTKHLHLKDIKSLTEYLRFKLAKKAVEGLWLSPFYKCWLLVFRK